MFARFLFVVGSAGVLVLSGCAREDASASGGTVIASDTTCEPDFSTLESGAHTFTFTNNGSKVNEVEFLAPGDRAIGELENLAPGTTREFTVELPAGEYEVACKPDMVGKGIRSALTVTGADTTEAIDPTLAAAVADYRAYVNEQAALAITETEPFAAAVKAGNVDQAKALYGPSRVPWERIEPIAESFGDLDPRVDARENDVEEGTEWTGWHRLEKDLWVDGLQADSGAMADQLLADLGELQTNVDSAEMLPSQLSNGAQGLLDEVATGKITGEEERYSRLDLLDFQANIDGAKVAIDFLRPYLETRNVELVNEIDQQFAAVNDDLAQHRDGESFVGYDTLTPEQIRSLADNVEALSEPLSQVTGVVTGK